MPREAFAPRGRSLSVTERAPCLKPARLSSLAQGKSRCPQSPSGGPSSCDSRSRSATAAPAGRGRMPAVRCALRQDRVPGRVPRSRLSVRLRIRGVRTHLHRLHVEGLRGRDRRRPLARGRVAARRLRRSQVETPAAPDVPRRGGGDLPPSRRRAGLPEPGVLGAPGRPPHLPSLRAAPLTREAAKPPHESDRARV